ncbi:MAG: glycosyltransferase family 4 protein [Acidimicrobiales bacterium]
MSTALAVHQFVPSLAVHDAIGQHTFALQGYLRRIGIESEIYADEMKPGTENRCRHYREFKSDPLTSTTLIYQASTASPIAGFLTARREPKLVNFHNVTPSEMAIAWDFGVGIAMAMAEHQIGKLSNQCELAFTVSEFNRESLKRLGYTKTAVASPFIELRPPVLVDRRICESGARWLFVGRIFPNKAQLELVAALAVYRQLYDPAATLTLVGSRAIERYAVAVERYAEELGLADAVLLQGQVSDAELGALYGSADVFVSASRHEGFCFPLIEAMRSALPIVAFASSAIPETLGRAGVLVSSADPVEFAAAVRLALTDRDVRAEIRGGADEQLDKFSTQVAEREHHRALASVIENFPPYQGGR